MSRKDTKIESLAADNAALRGQLTAARTRNTELEGRLHSEDELRDVAAALLAEREAIDTAKATPPATPPPAPPPPPPLPAAARTPREAIRLSLQRHAEASAKYAGRR